MAHGAPFVPRDAAATQIQWSIMGQTWRGRREPQNQSQHSSLRDIKIANDAPH